MAKYIGFVVDEGGTESTYKYALNKYDATAAPGVNNDVDEGYKVGSFWFDVTNDDAYVCLDNTDGAAVWVQIDAAGGAVDAADVTYTPAVLTDWDGDADPGDVDEALDQLAERVDDLEGSGHAAVTMSGTPDYITLSGQDIVRGLVDLATTGAPWTGADVTGVLPVANGGLGSNLSAAPDGLLYLISSTPRATGLIPLGMSILAGDPGADRLVFWDDTTNALEYLTAGTGLSISGTTISATGYAPGGTDVALADGGTGASLADPGADRIMFWDDSAGQVTWLSLSGLTITTTTLAVDAATTSAAGKVELATDAEVVTGSDTSRVSPVSSMKHHRLMAKSWVIFDGTGTVSIGDSENVSSITDGGTGIYTVNLTTAHSSTNYAPIASCGQTGNRVHCDTPTGSRAAGSYLIVTTNLSGTTLDVGTVAACTFGGQ